jgi:hypothetical protein
MNFQLGLKFNVSRSPPKALPQINTSDKLIVRKTPNENRTNKFSVIRFILP